MNTLPSVVAKKLNCLIPESLKNDITSFSFIPQFETGEDGRPDVVVSTKSGEVIEIKDRKNLHTLFLGRPVQIDRISLHKRRNSKYFTYVLQSKDSVYFVIKENDDEMMLVKKYFDVLKVEFEDINVSGDVRVKLWCKDDAIPTILNEDYSMQVNVVEKAIVSNNDGNDLCVLLKEKLAQAKLNKAYNKKVYEEKKLYRQELMNLVENVERFGRDGTKQEDIMAVDKLKTEEIWLRTHNAKVIIGVPIINESSSLTDGVQLFVKCQQIDVFSYNTKLYNEVEDKAPPYWTELTKETIDSHKRFTCLCTFDVPEFDDFANVTLNMALRYNVDSKSFCIPLDDVNIKAVDVVNSKYDPVLNIQKAFGSEDVLSIISTSVHEELNIFPVDNAIIDFKQLFIDKLNFATRQSRHYGDILIHAQSPLNVLHGMTLYTTMDTTRDLTNVYKMHIFARSIKQILMLVNLIYDQIPLRCAILPKDFTAKLKQSATSTQNYMDSVDISQDMDVDSIGDSNLTELASLMSQQVSAVVTHLEKCMEAMSEVNLKNINSKCNDNSINIDVDALGRDEYEKLWHLMLHKMSLTKDLLKCVK